MLYLLGNQEIKKLKNPSNAGINRRELINLSSLCDKELNYYLEYDFKKMYDSDTEKLLGKILFRFDNTPSLYYRNEFTFCKECISKGYHSILHQVDLFNKCFYHDIPLENRCPMCKRQYPYLLSDSGFMDAFICECGYTFNNIVDRREKFRQWTSFLSNFNIKNQRVLDWFNLNLDDYIYYASNYFLDKTQLEYMNIRSTFFYESLLKHYFSKGYGETISKSTSSKKIFSTRLTTGEVMKEQTENYNWLVKDIQDYYKKCAKNPWGERRYRHFYTEIYMDSISTYKSIARYIRKKVLKKHIKHLEDKKFYIVKNKITCKYSYVYYLWRYFVEGDDVFRYINSGIDKRIKKHVEVFCMNYPWNHEFENILYQFFDVSTLTDYSLSAIKWLINHTLAHLLLSLFVICLREVRSVESLTFNDLHQNITFKMYEYIPDFTIIVPKDKNKEMYFYKTRSIIQKIQEELVVMD
ncbi:hypothetical protein P6P90_03605 [Ectobacillus antri]|uniref:Transposon Tn7 transposition protein TnsD C-termianl domain-containing protein n=1 Tax=Ectobacillus antri TaxID=2486280 RepID=A0ABT6H276_9BACI|nr:hypothetical protein [Ectobacillus antri]MDG4656410.1 hypothetical protein [Ectobacillus antri]MDG5753085.1 hypothetical protein [Ectobacillus antri]